MPFLPERMKIDKTQKLVYNLRDKKKYVVYIKTSIKSWVKIKESAQSNRILSRSMVKEIY